MAFLTRYRNGEYEAVYAALVSINAQDDDAYAVAQEIAQRVRHNIELLVTRWRQHGFTLAAPLADPVLSSTLLVQLEQTVGKLPPTLHAFYRHVGGIHFIEDPPGSPWPERTAIDAIAIDDLTDQLADMLTGETQDLILFADHLVKYGISGVGSVYVPLPVRAFDPILYFEGEPIIWPDEQPLRFVPYLRRTLLERGGMGIAGLPSNELNQHLVATLTEHLVPF